VLVDAQHLAGHARPGLQQVVGRGAQRDESRDHPCVWPLFFVVVGSLAPIPLAQIHFTWMRAAPEEK
jgi:hypothetical protein